MKYDWVLCLLLCGVAMPSQAQARNTVITCERAQAGSILVDGVTTDWKNVSTAKLDSRGQLLSLSGGSWSGAADLSGTVRCVYTAKKLFFLFKVKDEYVVRFKRLTAKQDRMLLLFKGQQGLRRMAFYPPDGRHKPAYGWLPESKTGRRKRRRRSRGRRKLRLPKPRGVNAAVIRLERGYAVEMEMLNDAVPGYGRGSPAMRFSAVFEDVDAKANPQLQARMSTGKTTGRLGRVDFEEAKLLLGRFLKDQGFSAGQIRINRVGNLVSGKSLERVVIAGRKIAVLGGDITGGGYFFMTLPVHKPAHVLRFAIKDMNGDGQDEILMRLRQMKNNRGREIYVVYRYDNRKLNVVFGHEVVHRVDNKILLNDYRYIKTKNGIDMVFAVGRCRGFNSRNHVAHPPKDLQGILTPWGEKKKVRYRFNADSYVEVPMKR
jgi:hypothetical protein